MPQTVAVFVCASDVKAAEARAFLEADGFPPQNITIEQASCSYDSIKFGKPNGKKDLTPNAFVVTGRL